MGRWRQNLETIAHGIVGVLVVEIEQDGLL